MRSIYDNAQLSGYAAASNTTGMLVTTGASVDTKGYNTAALRVFVGPFQSGANTPATTKGSVTALLQESSDNVTFATAVDNTGATIQAVATQTGSTVGVIADARIEGLGLQRKRYLRIVATAAMIPASAGEAKWNQFTSCAVIELSRAYQDPTTSTVSNT